MSDLQQRTGPGVRLTLLADEKAASGEPIDLGDRLVSFTFDDSASKADKISLELDNFDLSLFERPELVGGNVLEVSWGYPGFMALPRRIVLKKLKGFATLKVEGQATSVLMNREAKTRRWENATRSQIVREIAAEHGYDGAFLDVQDTGETYDVVNQAAETDARFLRRLAAREEFEFHVDDRGLHWHERRHDTPPTRVLTWYADPGRGDVLSVDVETDLVRRAGKVTVRGRDPMARATVQVSATSDSVARATLGDVVETVDPETGSTRLETRNATETVHATPATNQARAEKESAARFRRAERATVKLSMQVVGDPTLRAKEVVEVRGISSLLSGKYFVNEVKHTVSGSGYLCDLKLTRDGGGRHARPKARAQGGEKNTAAPRQDAELSQVEAVDPESGATRIEFRRDGRPMGSEDPEAKR